jgi:hypothetical protein
MMAPIVAPRLVAPVALGRAPHARAEAAGRTRAAPVRARGVARAPVTLRAAPVGGRALRVPPLRARGRLRGSECVCMNVSELAVRTRALEALRCAARVRAHLTRAVRQRTRVHRQPFAGPTVALAVAIGGSGFFFGTRLTELKAAINEQKASQEAAVKELKASQEAAVKELKASQEAAVKELKASQEVIHDDLQDVLGALKGVQAMLYDVPRALTSVAAGLQEAALGGPVHALVAASRDDVETWLTQAGFREYVPTLAPLGGPTLLLQTEASLLAAGVAPQHTKALLKKLEAAAQAPPSADARSGA